MGLPETVLLVFAAISLCVLACALVVRDLWATARSTSVPSRPALRLRRNTELTDRASSTALFEQIDRGFDRLVLESGMELTPLTVFLGLFASGLLLGGGLWLYSDEPLQGIAGGLIGMAIPFWP